MKLTVAVLFPEPSWILQYKNYRNMGNMPAETMEYKGVFFNNFIY